MNYGFGEGWYTGRGEGMKGEMWGESPGYCLGLTGRIKISILPLALLLSEHNMGFMLSCGLLGAERGREPPLTPQQQ